MISKKDIEFGSYDPMSPQSRTPIKKLTARLAAPAFYRYAALHIKTPSMARHRQEITERAQGYPTLRFASLPPRQAAAPTGSEFLAMTESLSFFEREQAIYREIKRGNVPRFMRELKPILLKSITTTRSGTPHVQKAIVWVTPDYLAIGSDDDFLRIPMNLHTATRLADEFGFMLPTQKIVDAIYEQSYVKVRPQPLPPGPAMQSNAYYARHQQLIETGIGRYRPGQLISGHKKDVVTNPKLNRKPGSIAIYGWHRLDGRPIQPLSNVHSADYADYSHGIRLVARFVEIDGHEDSMDKVLTASNTATIFNYKEQY